ncbi:hypothetical protein ABVF61_19165 [Roseibium sp. HPY-6]|uniref:hypothetical protein n=1 Tax=Roseibium sp. HPY-6 TaxID=3229852 RepID=UPI00338FDF4C
MQLYHDREEAEKQLAMEMRVITPPCGEERAIRLEKYVWDEYDFITGRIYGHPYRTDAGMIEWAEQSAAEINMPFDYALDQLVKYSIFILTGKRLPKETGLFAEA